MSAPCWPLVAMFAWLTCACAGTAPHQPDAPEPVAADHVAAWEDDMAGQELALEDALERLAQAPETPPDPDRCQAACTHCHAVCDLAERICHIAEREGRPDALAGRCADASRRCKRATHLTQAVCDCREVERRIRI